MKQTERTELEINAFAREVEFDIEMYNLSMKLVSDSLGKELNETSTTKYIYDDSGKLIETITETYKPHEIAFQAAETMRQAMENLKRLAGLAGENPNLLTPEQTDIMLKAISGSKLN